MSKWSSAFRDSRWQQKRLKIMERDQWTCQSCGASGEGVTLNVHHIFYEKGKAPWEYENEMLVTWCETCHGKRHELQKRLLKGMSSIPIDPLVEITTGIERIDHRLIASFIDLVIDYGIDEYTMLQFLVPLKELLWKAGEAAKGEEVDNG